MPFVFCMGDSAPWPATPSKAGGKRLPPLPNASEVEALGEVLAALGGGVASLLSAAESVEKAREPLRGALRHVSPTEDLASDLAAAFDGCAARLRCCAAFAEEAKRLVAEAQSRSCRAKASLAAREAAWGPKVQSDRRAAALERRFARPLPAAERRERLQARAQANDEFRRHSEDAKAALSALGRDRPSIVAGVLAQVCRCYATALGDDDPAGDAFGSIAPRIVAAGEAAAAVALSAPGEVAEEESSEEATTEEGDEPADVPTDQTAEPEHHVVADAPASPSPPPAAASAAEVPSGSGEAVAVEASQAVDAAEAPAAPSPPSAVSVAGEQALCGTGGAAAAEAADVQPPADVDEAAGLPAAPPARASTQDASQLLVGSGSAEDASLHLVEGAEVEIWSSSRQQWMAGTIEHVFDTDSISDGYRVPAGAVKVVFGHGMRFVRAEDVGKELRAPMAATSVDKA